MNQTNQDIIVLKLGQEMLDYEIFEDTNGPVTGFVYDNFNDGIGSSILNGPNGKPIESEFEYRNGFRMGWYREYYPSGQLKESQLHYFQLPLLYLTFEESGIRTEIIFTTGEDDCRSMIKKYNLIDCELDDFLG